MRSALSEEMVARSEGEDVRDTVFTVPLLRDCIINMIHDMEKDIELPLKKGVDMITTQEGPWKWFTTSDLGFPLVDDDCSRPMHPLVVSYVSDCLKDPEILDDNEEAGHLCDDSALGLPEQMKHMLSDWGQQAWALGLGAWERRVWVRGG